MVASRWVKGGGRGGVGEVVGGDVHRLDRGDGPVPGGCDALLEGAHLVGQGGLIAHGRGHPAHQGGDLGAGLDVPEDVVNEQQHILLLPVPEILGHGQPREGHPASGPRGGSFIWPKTRAVLLSTPESLISRQRSLPSRVRSPTPVKME